MRATYRATYEWNLACGKRRTALDISTQYGDRTGGVCTGAPERLVLARLRAQLTRTMMELDTERSCVIPRKAIP